MISTPLSTRGVGEAQRRKVVWTRSVSHSFPPWRMQLCDDFTRMRYVHFCINFPEKFKLCFRNHCTCLCFGEYERGKKTTVYFVWNHDSEKSDMLILWWLILNQKIVTMRHIYFCLNCWSKMPIQIWLWLYSIDIHAHTKAWQVIFALQASAGGIEDAEYGSRLVEQHRQ